MKSKIVQFKHVILCGVIMLLMMVIAHNVIAQRNTSPSDQKTDALFKAATLDKGLSTGNNFVDPRQAVGFKPGSTQSGANTREKTTVPVDPRTEGIPKPPDQKIDEAISNHRGTDPHYVLATKLNTVQFSNTACGTYSSGEFIQGSSEIIAAKGCVTTVNSKTSTVYFKAQNRITLSAGFVASSGSRFVAYVEPPSSTSSKVAVSDVEKNINNADIIFKNGISITPNPFYSTFELTITSTQDERARIVVYNSLGIKVQEKQAVSLSKGFNKVTFDCSNMAKGVYLAEINFGNEKYVKKIIRN